MKCLKIDASARTEGSSSRDMANQLIAQLSKNHSGLQLIERDVVQNPIPHISQATITGFYTVADQLTPSLKEATRLSDTLIKELEQADILVISCPMYNFSIPSALKAWVDQIVRINRTFGVAEDNSFYGMIPDKPTYLVTSAGAVYGNETMQAFDFVSPYLKTVLGLIGISNITILPLEGSSLDPIAFEQSKTKALRTISTL